MVSILPLFFSALVNYTERHSNDLYRAIALDDVPINNNNNEESNENSNNGDGGAKTTLAENDANVCWMFMHVDCSIFLIDFCCYFKYILFYRVSNWINSSRNHQILKMLQNSLNWINLRIHHRMKILQMWKALKLKKSGNNFKKLSFFIHIKPVKMFIVFHSHLIKVTSLSYSYM